MKASSIFIVHKKVEYLGLNVKFLGLMTFRDPNVSSSVLVFSGNSILQARTQNQPV